VSPREDDSPASRADLRADCANCAGLCCVAPAFAASADFAIDKPAGQPCPNLAPDFRCGIHADLRQRGFAGCTVYDCFGAGQKVSRLTFAGTDWQRRPSVAPQMFAAFAVMRALHELLWYLSEARALVGAHRMGDELAAALEQTEALTAGDADALLALDVDAHRQRVNALLQRASAHARAGSPGADRRGADLIGADLRGTGLRGANLRGALLVGADLRQADLTLADVTGADLRGADLRGADLSGALFLTRSQLDAAYGDQSTLLPASLARPAHWPAGPGAPER
jgi:uncharacterized protein YjbI with pentapeptide repeats